MEDIKYLLTLTPVKMLIAAMMLVIVFLATGWMRSDMAFSEYRTKNEAATSLRDHEAAQLNITLFNRLIDGQTKRGDQLDSSVKKSTEAVADIKEFLKKSKK